MALKNNIRSIRFSDELMEIINDQVGDNFNQRFERLVYNCYMLLPEKERQLAQLEARIRTKQEELAEALEQSAERLMEPYAVSGRFCFQGVRG